MKHKLIRTFQLAALSCVIAATMVAQPVAAASACKGLERMACEANKNCRWLSGYTRKDGVQVSSHCRSLPKKSASTAAKKASEPKTAGASRSTKEQTRTAKQAASTARTP